MIVDSSALVAILRREPEATAFLEKILRAAEPVRMSAASYLEVSIVIDRANDPVASRRVDDLIQYLGMTIEPFDASQATIARDAYRDFGRGSGHPAGLNFGDCITYALARSKRERLLFKGADFAHTDLNKVELLDE